MKKIIIIGMAILPFADCFAQRRLSFRPQQHGFHFHNYFTNQVKILGHHAGQTDGLCGGMALAAFNYFRYNIPIPPYRDGDINFDVTAHVPAVTSNAASALVEYIFQSQIATFTNVSGLSFFGDGHADYMSEFNKVKARIDRGEYLILGLKMRPGVGGMGHQVLAYGYNDATREVYIYDSNFPDEEICIVPAESKSGPAIALYSGKRLVSESYKSMFEAQELFVNRTSTRTTYDIADNNNYAVRPPTVGAAVTPRPTVGHDFARAIPANNLYELRNEQNGKMVEVEDAVFAKGTKVQQFRDYETNGLCDGHNQKWVIIPAGNRSGSQAFYIFNYGFNKYMQADDRVTVQRGTDQSNQLWVLEPTATTGMYFIKSLGSARYLQVSVTQPGDGEQLQMGAFSGHTNQQFRFISYVGLTGPQNYPAGSFVNICPVQNTGKTINVAHNSTGNGAAIQLYDVISGAQNEHWQLVRTPDGYYRMKPRLASTNKCADINGGTGNANTGLLSWDCVEEVEKQKWLIIPVVREPGNHIIFNKSSGRCMDIANASTANGAAIQLYHFVNQDNQKWRFQPAR
jgi:hypothetical protein